MAISLDTQDIEQRNPRPAGPTRLCMPGLQMRMPEILLLLIMMLLLLMMLLEILLLLMAMLLQLLGILMRLLEILFLLMVMLLLLLGILMMLLVLALMLWQGQAGLHSSFQLMPIWDLKLGCLRLRISL